VDPDDDGDFRSIVHVEPETAGYFSPNEIN
jgi:hypothetical protein